MMIQSEQAMSDKIVFCDTNVIRYLIDEPSKSDAFCQYLRVHQAVMGVSLVQILEVKKIPRYHEPLSRLLLSAPAMLLKWWKQVLAEESELYPNTAKVDVLVRPSINDMFDGQEGRFELQESINGPDIEVMWSVLAGHFDEYAKVLSWLPSTKLHTASDMDAQDFDLHNFGAVIREIRDVNPSFLESFRHNATHLHPRLFIGSYLRAAYIYHRYILKGMKPKPSDIGDIIQVFYTPYCDEVILEKSMAGFLSQIQKQRMLLGSVKIKSSRFVRQL